MNAEQRQQALEMLTAQAKEAVIVKVLERIADALEALSKTLDPARTRGCCWTCRWAEISTDEGGSIDHTGCDNPDIPAEVFDEMERNGWDIDLPPCRYWEEKK